MIARRRRPHVLDARDICTSHCIFVDGPHLDPTVARRLTDDRHGFNSIRRGGTGGRAELSAVRSKEGHDEVDALFLNDAARVVIRGQRHQIDVRKGRVEPAINGDARLERAGRVRADGERAGKDQGPGAWMRPSAGSQEGF